MSFPYKMPPMEHQLVTMKWAWQKPAVALFHEMGVGKSYTVINLAGAYFRKDMIKAVIVICPTPIKSVWDLEVEKMSPVDAEVYVYKSGDKGLDNFMATPSDKLKYLVVGIEALSQGKAFEQTMKFARAYSGKGVMVVCDESSKIKNAQAARTKKAVKIAEIGDYRLILTGTPITQGIEDLYGQFQFLDSNIIGCKSYFVFKSMYCVMGGFENRNIIGYQRKEELLEMVKPYVSIIKSEEAMDLPDKTYVKYTVEPTKQQLAAMKSLKDLFEAEMGEHTLTVATILERMTRYQQIAGGNFPYDDVDSGGYLTKPIEGKNPKLDALVESIDTLASTDKVIIWARFRPEIGLIAMTLRAMYGDDSVVEFHGGVNDADRRAAILGFQEDAKIRFFVVNQQTGSMGLTLTAATKVYYYSNSFSYEERVQSEKRNHRKGQSKHCLYIDLELNVHEDKMILAAIRNKASLADYVEVELKK